MRMGCPSCGRDVDCPPGTDRLTCPGCGFTAPVEPVPEAPAGAPPPAAAVSPASGTAAREAPGARPPAAGPPVQEATPAHDDRSALPWLECPRCATKVMLQPGAQEVVCPGCMFAGTPPEEDPPPELVDAWRGALGMLPRPASRDEGAGADAAATDAQAVDGTRAAAEAPAREAPTEEGSDAADPEAARDAPRKEASESAGAQVHEGPVEDASQTAHQAATEVASSTAQGHAAGWIPVQEEALSGWRPVQEEGPRATPGAGQADAGPPAAAWAPAASAHTSGPRPRRLGWNTGFAVLAVLFGVVGLIVDFTAPWLDPDVGPNQDRADVVDAGGYIEHMAVWPLAAFIVLIVVGVGLIGVRLAPLPAAAKRAAQAALVGTGALMSFMLLLSAVRLFGMYILDAARAGEIGYHLHVVPYLHLVMGVVLFSVAVSGLKRLWAAARDGPGRGHLPDVAGRAAALTVAVSAGLMLLMPWFPFASIEMPGIAGGGSDPLGEAALGTMRDSGTTSLERPGTDLLVFRAMLWTGIGLSAAAWAWSAADATGRIPPRQPWLPYIGPAIYTLAALAWVTALVFVVLLYVHIAGMDDGIGADVAISWNHLPLLGIIALGLLHAWHAVRVAWPGIQAVQEATHG